MSSLFYALLWASLLFYILGDHPKRQVLGRLGTALILTTVAVLTLFLVERAHDSGHWPLTNRYEFALCLVWVMLVIYLLFEASWGSRQAGAFALPVVLLIATYALTRTADEQLMKPLLPVLRTIWLPLHGISTLVGYAGSGLAAGLGIMRLWHKETSRDISPVSMKTVADIERAIERLIALSFPWLTLGLLTGGIWAQFAWGRYWDWDPKESWTLIVWLWYLLILHLRSLKSWRHRKIAWLALIGFGLVFFSFVGVPWLVRTIRLESLHGF